MGWMTDSREREFAAAGKPVAGLETVEQQMGIFDQLPEASQRRFLVSALDDPAEHQGELATLLNMWSAGDEAAIGMFFDEDLREDSALKRALLTQRNETWAKKIIDRLETPGTVLVAVGAGHLAGEGSVQSILQREGLSATRLETSHTSAVDDAGEGNGPNGANSAGPKHPCAGREGGAGGHDIVYEKHARRRFTPTDTKGATYLFDSLGRRCPPLRPSIALTLKDLTYRPPPGGAEGVGNDNGLIETAIPESFTRDRHGHERRFGTGRRHHVEDDTSEASRELFTSFVFERVEDRGCRVGKDHRLPRGCDVRRTLGAPWNAATPRMAAAFTDTGRDDPHEPPIALIAERHPREATPCARQRGEEVKKPTKDARKKHLLMVPAQLSHIARRSVPIHTSAYSPLRGVNVGHRHTRR